MLLHDRLHRRLEAHPDALAFRFLEDGDVDGPQSAWTIRELITRAAGVAEQLRDAGQAGRPVLLVYPPGLDFFAGFLGCQLGGAIPVPVYPPNPSDLERATQRIRAVGDDCGASHLLTTQPLEQIATAFGDQLGALSGYRWLSTDTCPPVPLESLRWPGAEPDTIAFLQYTSGSTGAPKGVVVRHGELAFNLAACHAALHFEHHFVSWLPTYHDMGLIGGALTPLAQGVGVTFMAPHAFLMKPTRWMAAISHFRAQATAGPNFGYHLAARRTTEADLVGLDLSCLRAAVIGAEPISPMMVEDLLRVFAPAGLDPRALYPAYGMAEATLLISTKIQRDPPVLSSFDRGALAAGQARPAAEGAVRLVGCGQSIPGQEIRIVDPDTLAVLPDGRVGEILVSGPSVAGAYWERPGSPREVFAVEVPGEERRYLRTGDLGFLWEGELYISGRYKDLLIIRGRNYAPADLEATVEELGERWGLRPGRVVAVSFPGDEREQAVILAELRADPGEAARVALAEAIAGRVAEHHGVALHAVSLLARGAIPLTSSGKVQRRATRAAWLDGTLDEIARIQLDRPADVTYGPLDHVRTRLDARASDYLFDLERDVPWGQLGAPGLYLPAALLTLFGIDPSPLARSREVYQTFQWAAALSVCRTFEHLEWGIIQFVRTQATSLPATRSLENLCVEEEKHIQLFRRIATHLAAQRPELAARFDAAYAANFAFLRELFSGAQGAELHYRIWLTTLFFEPATLHLAGQLERASEPIQPVWRQAHVLHAQEERLHVPTVAHYALGLKLEAAAQQRVAASFVADMRRGFLHLYGLAAPLDLICALWPGEIPSSAAPQGVPAAFADELLHDREFQPLKRILPGLDGVGAAPPPEPGLPKVIFVLSSERAGSTLLRVMLSAHPDLFAPPEMNLLGYASLGARAARLPTVQQGGLQTAIAALDGHDEARAEALVAEWTALDAPTASVYEHISAHIGHRVLVDKSPIYSRDIDALRRAEALYGDQARYVFLTRHPYAVIDSYARVGLERLVAERVGDADPLALGEMGWTLSNRTVQTFLAEVDPARWCTLRFEDLVVDPGGELARVCAFLRLPYSARMLEPYRFGQMAGASDMRAAVGDPNFQRHHGIDPTLGDAWRRVRLPRPLGAEARRVATAVGYALEADPAPVTATVPEASRVDLPTVRASVIETVARAARVPPSALNDQTAFNSLGLDSLELVQLTNALQARLGRPLPAMALYDHPTVGHLVAWLADGGSTPATRPLRPADDLDLSAEVWLDERVTPGAPAAVGGEILLTGATGFLGAYLLHELLAADTASVCCLVRAPDPEAGMARLGANLRRYGLDADRLSTRVSVVCGDLAAPAFGLGEPGFDALADRVASIVHNGALLHFGLGYRALAPANVAGTREVFRLATHRSLKPVHHVSSMAVFDSFQHWDGEVDESSDIRDWRGIRLGYTQTKWVSERLAALAGARGVPVNILRCAGIAGDSRGGPWNTSDLICRMIKGCVAMGYAPKLTFDLDMAPVDTISRALVWLARSQPTGGIYHLNHPRPIPWRRLVSWMQFQGYNIELEEHDAWVARLAREATDAAHPLASLVPFFTQRLAPDGLTQLQIREHRPRVGCAATLALLSGSGGIPPALDNRLLETWFQGLVHQGFLDAP